MGFITNTSFTFSLAQWSALDLLELVFYIIGAAIVYVCIPLLLWPFTP